jgi:hypothetical protein
LDQITQEVCDLRAHPELFPGSQSSEANAKPLSERKSPRARDCVVEDAVECEPVWGRNSLVTAKNTANCPGLNPRLRLPHLKSPSLSEICGKIPYPTEQGIFLRNEGF